MDVQIPLLTDILIVIGLSVVILLIAHRLRIPSVVGLLLTGILAGPRGLGLVHAAHEVEMLAEIGVVLLLFTIGLEFSLTKIFEIRRLVLLGGILQLVITVAISAGVIIVVGLPWQTALFIGFLVSLSSTAIVLKALQERAEIESPHGRLALAVLIFQDIAIVPMILLTPLLAGKEEAGGGSPLILVAKAAGIVAFAYVSSRFVVPWLLFQIARTRSRELFVLSVVAICFAIAWLTSSAGLSLGLGAFLAGLIISESEYSHQAMGGILPFRDVFTSLFFVSIGMLLDVRLLIEKPGIIAVIVLVGFIVKAFSGGAVPLLLGFPLRTMIMAGIALCQIGEFSFVLARAGVENGLIGDDIYQLFLAVSVLSMAATPVMMGLAPRLADLASRIPFLRRLEERSAVGVPDESSKEEPLTDHLVIIGFGISGTNIARAARRGNIPYAVIEANPETVKRERRRAERVIYGDAAYHAVLEHAAIDQARVIAVVINDPIATRQIIQQIRGMNPNAYILARTRFVREIAPLRLLGASEVIAEEFEASVELFSRIMAKYLIPPGEITRFTEEVLGEKYRMLRPQTDLSASVTDLVAGNPELELEVTEVAERSPLAGRTLADLDLRKRFGVTLLEVRRGDESHPNPAGDLTINAGDTLVVMGAQHDRARFAKQCGKKG